MNDKTQGGMMNDKTHAAPALPEVLVTVACTCGAVSTLNKNRPEKPAPKCGNCSAPLKL